MTADKTIFGLRFRSNERLQPSMEELRMFLSSPAGEGRGKLHGDDLATYRDLIAAVDSFEHDRRGSFGDRMLYGVLSHSHIVKPALKYAVEQYKFQMHALSELDLKKPAAFIESAEKEIARLNPKKKEKVAQIERLLGMIDERKSSLDTLKKRWLALAEELGHIIGYIRENLAKINKLSEEAIELLVNEQISRKKEGGLIEDIKTQYKEKLREALHQGTITQETLATAKEEVADLSKRTADLLRSDIYTLKRLYEAIHAYGQKVSAELEHVLAAVKSGKHASLEDDLEIYATAETILVSLVNDCRFDIPIADTVSDTTHREILVEKRSEMLDHIFTLLHKISPS